MILWNIDFLNWSILIFINLIEHLKKKDFKKLKKSFFIDHMNEMVEIKLGDKKIFVLGFIQLEISKFKTNFSLLKFQLNEVYFEWWIEH